MPAAGLAGLCADVAADRDELAGGVIRLTVDRESADAGALADAGLAFAPSLLACVGAAFSLLSADAPFNWLAESLTELLVTGRPWVSVFAEAALPAVAAYRGNPFCVPYRLAPRLL